MSALGDDKPPPETDERWLVEYIKFGFDGPKGLENYLKNHAAFDAYYARRVPDEEKPSGSPSPSE